MKAEPTSSLGSMPMARTKALETQSMRTMTGLAIFMTHMSGGTSSIAERSGPAIARFLGTISPTTTCR